MTVESPTLERICRAQLDFLEHQRTNPRTLCLGTGNETDLIWLFMELEPELDPPLRLDGYFYDGMTIVVYRNCEDLVGVM